AVTELASREVAALPIDAGQIDLLIQVLDKARMPGPRQSRAVARSLLIELNAKLLAGLVPAGILPRARQALASNEEGKPMPSIRDAYGHAPAYLRLVHTWAVNDIEHAVFHDADNGMLVEVHDPANGLTGCASMLVKYHDLANLNQPHALANTGMPVEVLTKLGPDAAKPRATRIGTAPPISSAHGLAVERKDFLASWHKNEGYDRAIEYRAYYDILTDNVSVYSRTVDTTGRGTHAANKHARDEFGASRGTKTKMFTFSGRAIIEEGKHDDPHLHPDLIRALTRIRPPRWRPTGKMPLIYVPRPKHHA
ncbi:MAG: hypothetical protein ACKVQK_29475, partial [Burkholderiales bacterium]